MGNTIHMESKVPTKERDRQDFEVLEELGTISVRGKVTLKLRYVKWGDNAPKYDIRPWKVDEEGNEIGLKGITLTGEELLTLKGILSEMGG